MITRKQASAIAASVKSESEFPITQQLVYDALRGRREVPLPVAVLLAESVEGLEIVPTQALLLHLDAKRSGQLLLERMPPPTSKKSVVDFDYDKGVWLNVTEDDIRGWQEAFPGVDVEQKLKQLAQWLFRRRPSERKKRHGSFIVNCLSKDQSEAGKRGKQSWNVRDLL